MRHGSLQRNLWRQIPVLGALVLVLLGAACGGGDDKTDGPAARNPTDPRRVPTATIPADRPTPIAALEIGQTRTTALPETYVVKAGDTLGTIASELGVSNEELTRANPGINPSGLRIGQELRIPRPSPTPTPSAVARGPATPTGSPGRTPAPSPTPTSTPTSTPGRSPATAGSPSPSPSASSPSPSPSPGARSPSPSATPTGTAATSSTYTVQAGDTGCAIARKLGVSITALAQANGMSVDALGNLRVGQVLQAPRSTGEGPGC